MENEQITLAKIYLELKNLERVLQDKGIINELEISKGYLIWDWPEKVEFFADDELFGEDWLSQEDEEAWKDL